MQYKPLKKFGQNFLIQPAIAQKIVNALNISHEDQVIEIGPGTGILTECIIQKYPAEFHAVEIDRNLAAELTRKFTDNIRILESDFLKLNLSDVISAKYKTKIIGNIPYNITSPILFKLLEHHRVIECAVFMMQKEVAKRIVADKGTKDYGILSVMMRTYANVNYLFEVNRKNFRPIPKVDSAIVKFIFLNEIEGIENLKLYKQIVRHVFNFRRKMLRNSLSRIFAQSIVTSLDNFDLTQRPEQLSVDELKLLANKVNQII